MAASRTSHWITQSNEAAGAFTNVGQPGSASQAHDGTAYPPRSPAQSTSAGAAAAHPQLLPNAHARSAIASSDPYSAVSPDTASATRYPLLHASERTSGTAGAQGTGPWQQNAAPSASWTPAGSQGFAIGGNAATGQGDRQRGRTGTSRTQQQIFGTPQVGVIGRHKPRDMIRLDRDYTAGEVCQFWSGYPFELEGRVRPRAHLRPGVSGRLTDSLNCYGADNGDGAPERHERAQQHTGVRFRSTKVDLRQRHCSLDAVSLDLAAVEPL